MLNPLALIRRAGSAPRPRASRRFSEAFESLEGRVLLSGGVERLLWGGGEVPVVGGSFVVSFSGRVDASEGYARVSELGRLLGVGVSGVEVLGLGYSAVFRAEGAVSEGSALAAVSRVGGVSGLVPNRVYEPLAVPNDPLFGEQWQLENTGQFVPGSGVGLPDADVDASSAWEVTVGAAGVIIAVVDTGVDMDHPDLAANLWVHPGEVPGNGLDDDGNGFIDDVSGWDFGESDNDPDDEYGHGTMVAGTIGAVGNNGLGVAGLAWNVSILPMKIADRYGRLSTAAIIGAHDYLTLMRSLGYNVVASNNSYGGFAPDFYADAPTGYDPERDAIERFVNSGGTFVASAGNSAMDNDESLTAFPASYNIPGVIAVAATDNVDALAAFSNWGAERVDLGAPGVDVRTTAMGGGYTYASGTSFSGPMVAGAVGLLAAYRPEASPVQIYTALVDGADRVASLQNRVVSGGRLNAAASLRIIGLDGPVVTAVSPGPTTGRFEELVLSFNKPLDASVLDVSHVRLERSGEDGTFGDGNEVVIGLSGLSLSADGRTVTVTPSDPPVRRVDDYRLTLSWEGFADTDGNYLNGDESGGSDEVYAFALVAVSGSYEPNDTLATAYSLGSFTGSGQAQVTGVTVGDGVQGPLDVDLFSVTIPRGGLITARVDAANLASPSPLDSYLRLFDARGQELNANDQYHGSDSFLDFYVTTGGVYYVGVSGFGNGVYDPLVAGSGQAQSTGSYNLTVGVDLIRDDFASYGTGEIEQLIPDLGQVLSTVSVPDTRQILDVNVRLEVRHPFVGDLRISLISPSGDESVLIARRGGSGDDLSGTLFDDEASSGIGSGVAPFTGSYRPETPLSVFDGESGNGVWTLAVHDDAQLHEGRLLGWTLEFRFASDIFGAFELNDTLTRARDLWAGVGAGQATRQAWIGDGFGPLDVDLFRFVAEAGSTLTAQLTTGGGGGGGGSIPLDGALRLFDASGAELNLASPGGSTDARIEGYTFVDGGTYYVGVSGSGNTVYDPAVALSGSDNGSAGSYTLGVSVTPGVSDRARVLTGDEVSVGLGSDASLGTGGTALVFDGVELLVDPGSGLAESFFGLSAGGMNFRNGDGGGGVPMRLTDQSDVFNRRIVTTGLFNGVWIERSLSYAVGDPFLAVDVTLRNTTDALLRSLAWMEAFNPVMGLNLRFNPTRSTINDVEGLLATASHRTNTYPEGLTVGLAAPASEGRAVATFAEVSAVIRDPFQLLAGPLDPDGMAADQVMALAYDLGDLGAGESVTVRYFILAGRTPDEVAQLYGRINDGTGTGHLAVDPMAPASEALDDGSSAPTLPYRLYHPEGFANYRSSTFVPIVNPNAGPARVVVIARYEDPSTGPRDQVLYDAVLAGDSRGGITITTPQLFAVDGQLVRPDTPYALEVRSSLPVGAMLSHYDFGAATGESFTAATSRVWTFGEGFKAQRVRDFIVFYNTTDATVKVDTTIYPEGQAAPVTLTAVLGPHRRGGWNLWRNGAVPAGPFGIRVSAPAPVVAALTHYDTNLGGGFGVLGTAGEGSVSGVNPGGELGVNADNEFLTVLNTQDETARVLFTFLFDNGSAYRQTLTAPGRMRSGLNLSTLPGFDGVALGQAYSILYESLNGVPVTVTLPSFGFGEAEGSAFAERAATGWSFAEGFRPPTGNTAVTELLRVFNPNGSDTLVEITLRYTDGAAATVRRVITARTALELDLHELVDADRRDAQAYYGVSVQAANPVVAHLVHADAFLGGAFATLGNPLGVTQTVL